MKNRLFYIAFIPLAFVCGVEFAHAAPSISITSPNGGEAWKVGQTYNITWSQQNVDKVNITLIQSGSVIVNGIVYDYAVNSNATSGSYSYTVPNDITFNNNYKIRILAYQTGIGSITDESDNTFQISVDPPTISSITPNSGSIGASVNIIGTNFISAANVGTDVSFILNGNVAYKLTGISSVDGKTLNFSIPPGLATGTYQVTASNGKGATAPLNFTVIGTTNLSSLPSPTATVDIKISGSDGPVLVRKGDPIAVIWTSQNVDYCGGTGYDFLTSKYGYWVNATYKILPTSGTEFFTPSSNINDITLGITCYKTPGFGSSDTINIRIVDNFNTQVPTPTPPISAPTQTPTPASIPAPTQETAPKKISTPPPFLQQKLQPKTTAPLSDSPPAAEKKPTTIPSAGTAESSATSKTKTIEKQLEEKLVEKGVVSYILEVNSQSANEDDKQIYEVVGRKQVKLFMFIPIYMEVRVEVTSSGEIFKTKKPWWSFLASGSE